MSDPERLHGAALARLRRRDSAGAERLLQQTLALCPDHAASLHLAGLLAGRDGRDNACVALLERAIMVGTPDQQEASGLLLAAAHRRAGRVAEAEAACRQVLRAMPYSAEALLKLGQLLGEQGRNDAAIDALRDAVIAAPGHAPAHAALATALYAAGELDEAECSAGQAVALAPGNRDFAGNWAVIRSAQGYFDHAAAICRQALAGGAEPGLLNTIGIALKALGELDDAAVGFEQALALRPGFVNALYNLAAVRKDKGLTDDAIALLRRLIDQAPEEEPHLPAARFALCMAHFPPFYADEAEIVRRRADYSCELEALEKHAGRAGAGSLTTGVGAAQPFQLAYQGEVDIDLQRRYGELVCRVMAESYPPSPLADPPLLHERVRVGFVCGHIRRHSVWQLPTRGWVEGLDRGRFELLGYHTSAQIDGETERATGLFDRFVQGPFSTERWRAAIAGDRPHVLIFPEIGMDPMVARLAAMRLAPRQYASWGHPTTSGYPTIDYFLSSADMEPDGAAAHYTENLVRLPGLSTPVTVKRPEVPVPSRAALGLPDDAVIYWSGQNLSKYLPQYDAIFPALARQVPYCRLIFIAFPGSPTLTERFRARLAEAFRLQSLDAERFCVFLPRMEQDAFHAAIGCANVVLDTIGWSGCNSLIDSLAHCVPIVTLPGETMRSRHGAAILRRIGLDCTIAVDPDDYVAIAKTLGTKPAHRAAVASEMRAGLKRLADRSAVVELEGHIFKPK